MCIDRALSGLNEMAKREGYHLRKLGSAPLREAEERMALALPAVADMPPEDRARMREAVDYFVMCRLLLLSMRLSSAAVQRMCAELLFPAALALTLDNDIADPRDVYMALAIICNASARVGVDADQIITGASKCGTPERAALMVGYLREADYVRSLRGVGVEFVDGTEGGHYVPGV